MSSDFELLIEDSNVTPFVLHALARVMAVDLAEFIPDPPRCILQFKNRNLLWYAEIPKWEKSAETIAGRVCDDPASYGPFTANLETDVGTLMTLSRSLYREDFSSYTREQIADVYGRVIAQYELVYTRGMVPTIADLHKPYLTEALMRLLAPHTDDSTAAFVVLTTPERMSTLLEEERDLIALAADQTIQADSSRLHEHHLRYFWLSFGYEGPLYTVNIIWEKVCAWRASLEKLEARKRELALHTRIENTVVAFEGGDTVIFSGEDGEHYCDARVRKSCVADSPIIAGQVAFKGRASGIVRIIRAPEDMKKMNEGDILVSPATNPNLLPAMRKAAAFVTDVGGITCHAAIVARELKKPCVIGTKVATKMLTDGDTVEVDAEKGIVTLVRRA